jgi:hypothetical protein
MGLGVYSLRLLVVLCWDTEIKKGWKRWDVLKMRRERDVLGREKVIVGSEVIWKNWMKLDVLG